MQGNVFVSGGTGYLGGELIRRLVARRHKVTALARSGSERKLPAGCAVVRGNALDAASFAHSVSADDTFVHLAGVAHPAPWKAPQFRAIDLESLKASATAAAAAGVRHFVFVSVAQPAPAMKAYVAVRQECERILERAGLTATILRPWYVLGPGHQWPRVLLPFYDLAERVPAWRDGALRLGLVTREQMVAALVRAIEDPPESTRVVGVPEIRAASSWLSSPHQAPLSVFAVPSIAAGSEPCGVSATSERRRG
jgi:uncharacterized protein YbjT (DUF2867 family)